MKKTLRSYQQGFTLIEIMVVVVILGILASFIAPRIMDKPDEARVTKAKQDISALGSALDIYRLDNFVYPTTDQGLEALLSPPPGNHCTFCSRILRAPVSPSSAQSASTKRLLKATG